MKATKNNHPVCHISAHFAGWAEKRSLRAACSCDSQYLRIDIFPQCDICYLGCQLKWEDGWNVKPFPACSIVQLSLVAHLLYGFLQVICQAWQAPYYFLPFDCPLCHSATLLLCHVISLILLTSSEQYLAICNSSNVSCQKMVPGNRVWEREGKLKSENKRLSKRKKR